MDVCEKITDGSHNPPKGVQSSNYLMLSSKNVFDDNLHFEDPRYLSESDFRIEDKRTGIKVGDVLLTIVGTIGRSAVVPPDTEKLTLQRSVAVIRPENGNICSRFLMYYFISHNDALNDQARGVAQKGIYLETLRDLPVEFPALPEQQRIVGILDEAFEGIATAASNAEKNRQNARALFISAFAALSSQSEQAHWSKTTVAAIAAPQKGSIRTGPFGSQLLHSEFVDEGIAVLGIDNAVANEFRWGESRFITPKKYQELKRYRVQPGDVLITIMGTCGRCAIVPDGIPAAINTKHLCCITLDRNKCLPGYLHAYFLYHPVAQEFLSKRAKGAIMAGLNMGIIEELPVLLPPTSQFPCRCLGCW
jgi:type I restriction enzyme S subunit